MIIFVKEWDQLEEMNVKAFAIAISLVFDPVFNFATEDVSYLTMNAFEYELPILQIHNETHVFE